MFVCLFVYLYICLFVCTINHPSLSQLTSHTNSKHLNVRHQCDTCSRSYSTKPALQSHRKKVHGEIADSDWGMSHWGVYLWFWARADLSLTCWGCNMFRRGGVLLKCSDILESAALNVMGVLQWSWVWAVITPMAHTPSNNPPLGIRGVTIWIRCHILTQECKDWPGFYIIVAQRSNMSTFLLVWAIR